MCACAEPPRDFAFHALADTTSIVGNSSLDWINSVIADKNHPPFFAWVGPHAPHLPSTPSVWYQDHPIGNTPVPKAVYYDYDPVGKHAFGAPYVTLDQQNPECDDAAIALEHSNRLKTLLSVDDIVEALYTALTAAGEWDNTFFLHSSDHGYSLGQFRVDSHKTQVWDHNTRVPMTVSPTEPCLTAVSRAVLSLPSSRSALCCATSAVHVS
jgi:N-acetylglucosamine-6-sulfatase